MPIQVKNGYDFVLEGEKPLPLLKEMMEKMKLTNPDNPLLKAKGFELVAIPEGQNQHEFCNHFLAHTAEPNKVYIAILKMGVMKTIHVDEVQMTGKCRANENLVKGARKWVTLHVVYREGGRELQGFETKGEAMNYAKQYAMNNNCNVYVELEKRLVGSQSRVADISPMKRQVKEDRSVTVNRFLFFGKGE